ncbi:MAG: GntR family transcriptional regulator [Rhodospirillales bacterium]|nr:GntR family transcriptional regulator [Rhodospirillales bacterium]
MNEKKTRELSRVDHLYLVIKEMAISFDFKPGKRINEVELAARLGASRTPLREALNRLVAEEFLTFQQGRGFFCRELKPREMFELYQFRSVLEAASVRLTCEYATAAEVQDLVDFLDQTGPEDGGRSSAELVALDEIFHQKLMALSRNREMARVLDNVNARIRYFRWVDMDARRAETQGEHRKIVAAIEARDADHAVQLMDLHINKRLDQITSAIKESYSRIYMAS